MLEGENERKGQGRMMGQVQSKNKEANNCTVINITLHPFLSIPSCPKPSQLGFEVSGKEDCIKMV